MRIGILGLFCFMGSSLGFAFQDPSSDAAAAFVDEVKTLTLNRELDARGNLGGVTVDRLGFVYVANFRDAVFRISPDGEVEVLTRSLYGSSGNAVDGRGDLYQANFFGNTITRITRDGRTSLFAGEGLNGPVGIAVDPEGFLVVCNCSGNTLSKVSPAGEVEPFAKSDLFACPNGITRDDEGNFYVSNFNNHELVKVTPDGVAGRFATVPGGAGNAHLVFSKNFFYVTKIISNQVVKVSKEGEVFPLAGTGARGNRDGPAPEATFASPNGIAVSPRGDLLYVNTLVGEYSKPVKSSMALRTIKLVTLADEMQAALQAGGVEKAAETYALYKADPVRGKENTVAEMVTFGYSLLSSRKVAEALRMFSLNAGSYPESAAAQYHLGEAHRYIGQTERALEQYRKTLKIDPQHALAHSRMAQLESSNQN